MPIYNPTHISFACSCRNMCDVEIVLANWVPWYASECAVEGNDECVGCDDEFGAIIFANSADEVAASTTPITHKSSPRVLAAHAVSANNGRAMVRAPARTGVALQKTPRPAAVKQHTRNKNHSPHKIAMLKACYEKNTKPGENEKQQLARSLKMTMDQVCMWFCNHRKRNNRPPTPVAP